MLLDVVCVHMLDTSQHYGPFTSELTRQHLTINPWGGGILWGEGQGGSDPHPQGQHTV